MGKHSHRQRPSLFWPLFLITVGGILLLSNLGILPPNSLSLLWRFWPLILVIMGLDILLGRKSAIGSIITSLVAILLIGGALAFIFFAQGMPDMTKHIDLGNLQHETIRYPRQNVESADVFIDWPSSPANLYSLSDSNDLIEGDINYYGNLYFDTEKQGSHADIKLDSRIEQFFITTGSSNEQKESWTVGLHPRVALNLELDAGSGSGNYNLEDLKINTLTVDAGSGPMDIILPNSGQIRGFIDGGSGFINLTLPPQMEAKLIIDEGSGSFRPGSRFHQTGDRDRDTHIWLSDNFQDADNYIELSIDQSSGDIQIR
ncbi:MAG TPA: DUF4097 domain-containing protein [Chloroflexi bacterium]|nr:MAG: hypothetical protein B6243_04440 [Anaerolineaceae bacterium 4572_5.2]HEY84653.1 DUF4097 domain-containing protein [Chloroflexota bacterium]